MATMSGAELITVWLTADSAPTDGLPFCAYGPTLVDEDFTPDGIVEAVWDDDAGLIGAVWDGCHDCWKTQPIEFTHWTRLAPPTNGERAREDEMHEKTLTNTDARGASQQVADLQVFGNGDLFVLLSKASSQAEGWMKSTKAMETPSGCVVQVTTQQRGHDGTYSTAEALTFVPGVRIGRGDDGKRRLVSL